MDRSESLLERHRRVGVALGRIDAAQLQRWAMDLALVLVRDRGRMLVAGNGGSAAQAQHLTAELVGRYRVDREPISALALHAETSSLTAIGNDFGFDEVFARQVRAHGRVGDVLLLLSTSGASRNLALAAQAATSMGVRVWAMTGSVPNPLSERCESVIAVEDPSAATVQEGHLMLLHALCELIDDLVVSPALLNSAPADPIDLNAGGRR